MTGPKRHTVRRAAVALTCAAGLAASAAGAAAAPAPSTASAEPSGPSNVATRTFSWPAAPPDTSGNPVTYEVALTATPTPPEGAGTPVDGTSTALAMPEGDAWFHVRSYEAGLLVPYSGWTTVGAFLTDTVPPAIVAVQDPAPNPRGWVNAPVTVAFGCADANIVSCPGPLAFGEGAGQVAAGTATDAGGNSAAVSHTVNVDLTPPAPALAAAPAEGTVVTSTRPVFRWSAGADEAAGSGLQYYDVWVGSPGTELEFAL